MKNRFRPQIDGFRVKNVVKDVRFQPKQEVGKERKPSQSSAGLVGTISSSLTTKRDLRTSDLQSLEGQQAGSKTMMDVEAIVKQATDHRDRMEYFRNWVQHACRRANQVSSSLVCKIREDWRTLQVRHRCLLSEIEDLLQKTKNLDQDLQLYSDRTLKNKQRDLSSIFDDARIVLQDFDSKLSGCSDIERLPTQRSTQQDNSEQRYQQRDNFFDSSASQSSHSRPKTHVFEKMTFREYITPTIPVASIIERRKIFEETSSKKAQQKIQVPIFSNNERAHLATTQESYDPFRTRNLLRTTAAFRYRLQRLEQMRVADDEPRFSLNKISPYPNL